MLSETSLRKENKENRREFGCFLRFFLFSIAVSHPSPGKEVIEVKSFIEKHSDLISGVLSGFDRLVVHGCLRWLSISIGMMDFLGRMGVLLKDFGDYVERTSLKLKAASLAEAKALNRPVKYLDSGNTNKEKIAREIMESDKIENGLICVLTSVEVCRSYEVHRNKKEKKLELKSRNRKCLHIYHYWKDDEFGFMSARIQTWFPFRIQVCLNGREWLSRQLDKAGISYVKSDNCFLKISDWTQAQELMQKQLTLNWSKSMDKIANRLNPAFNEIFNKYKISYYWTIYQSEWATDVMFKSSQALASIYPQLVRGAMSTFSSPDVMRFLGGKIFNGNFKGEVISSYKKRSEGVRVKHQVNVNSVKMYDKKGSGLRVETTLNDVRDFKVYKNNGVDSCEGKIQWRKMNKGISDIYRRTKISQASNNRYLEALASLDTDNKLIDLIHPVCQPVKRNGRRIRGLRPWWDEDRNLLIAIRRGEFCINGFRNRDILEILNPGIFSDPKEKRRTASKITRKIRMLRAHGIIRKVSKTHKYVFTKKGNKIIAAILGYQECTLYNVFKDVA